MSLRRSLVLPVALVVCTTACRDECISSEFPASCEGAADSKCTADSQCAPRLACTDRGYCYAKDAGSEG